MGRWVLSAEVMDLSWVKLERGGKGGGVSRNYGASGEGRGCGSCHAYHVYNSVGLSRAGATVMHTVTMCNQHDGSTTYCITVW